MTISWHQHVQKYREEHKCSYKEALQKASATYVKKVKSKKQPVEEPVEEGCPDPPLPTPTPVVTPTPKKLTKKQKLIELCEKMGLETKGTIQQLSDRIYNNSQ